MEAEGVRFDDLGSVFLIWTNTKLGSGDGALEDALQNAVLVNLSIFALDRVLGYQPANQGRYRHRDSSFGRELSSLVMSVVNPLSLHVLFASSCDFYLQRDFGISSLHPCRLHQSSDPRSTLRETIG